MKHLQHISRHRPQEGAAVHDNVCFIVNTVSEILFFLGGSAPILNYLNDKCTIPQPN